MNHINVNKYIYYRQDDVRLAIAHQIDSSIAVSEGQGSHIQLSQTNKHKTSLNIANFRYSKKYVFERKIRGLLVPKGVQQKCVQPCPGQTHLKH